jgi:16S rRNA processing protein RimM
MTRHADNKPRAGKDLVLLGRFGAAHGVRGEVRLISFTADPLAIGGYGPLLGVDGDRRFEFDALRPQGKDMLVARVKGVKDRNGAEALTGLDLFIERARLPEPDEDEFYLADLEGLRVENMRGETIGQIVALRNFGAGDILEIATPGARDTLMLPFTKAVAPIVDIAGGRVVVDPPEEIEGDAPEEA